MSVRTRVQELRGALGVALLFRGAGAGPAAAATIYNVSTVPGLVAAIDAVNAGSGGDTIVKRLTRIRAR
jgi:hypothetical protein